MFFAVLQSYSDTDRVEIDQFIDGCMQMRGHAAGIDIQILRCQATRIAKQIHSQKKVMKKVEKLLETVCAASSTANGDAWRISPPRSVSAGRSIPFKVNSTQHGPSTHGEREPWAKRMNL